MKLDNIFREIFNLDTDYKLEGLSPESLPEWDSFGHLTLIEAIENAYEITFEFEEMIEIENYDDIVSILKVKGVL